MNKQIKSIALKIAALAIVSTPCWLDVAPAMAGSSSASLAMSASIADNCLISAAPMSFGAYDPLGGGAVSGSANLTVTCTSGTTASVRLDQGGNADSGSTDAAPLRRMADGNGHFLSYGLFQESAHTTAWGNTAGTGEAHNGDGTAHTMTVFGLIAASQNVPAGSYSDSVQATINF